MNQLKSDNNHLTAQIQVLEIKTRKIEDYKREKNEALSEANFRFEQYKDLDRNLEKI